MRAAARLVLTHPAAQRVHPDHPRLPHRARSAGSARRLDGVRPDRGRRRRRHPPDRLLVLLRSAISAATSTRTQDLQARSPSCRPSSGCRRGARGVSAGAEAAASGRARPVHDGRRAGHGVRQRPSASSRRSHDQPRLRERASRKNLTVISGAGLVGRVVDVGRNDRDDPAGQRLRPSTSACRLSSGTQLAVGAVSGQRPRQADGPQLLDNTVRLRSASSWSRFGSGPGGPFVPEVPIGTITHVTPANGQLAQTATVQPFVDFGSLDIVAVVVQCSEVDQARQPAAGLADPRADRHRHGDRHAGVHYLAELGGLRRRRARRRRLPVRRRRRDRPADRPAPGRDRCRGAGQVCVVNRLHLPLGGPDLLLVVVVAFALVGGSQRGAVLGFFAGLAGRRDAADGPLRGASWRSPTPSSATSRACSMPARRARS